MMENNKIFGTLSKVCFFMFYFNYIQHCNAQKLSRNMNNSCNKRATLIGAQRDGH